jgi:hypothetical protein
LDKQNKQRAKENQYTIQTQILDQPTLCCPFCEDTGIIPEQFRSEPCLICPKYQARNGFGGMNKENQIFQFTELDEKNGFIPKDFKLLTESQLEAYNNKPEFSVWNGNGWDIDEVVKAEYEKLFLKIVNSSEFILYCKNVGIKYLRGNSVKLTSKVLSNFFFK